jgi:glycosyltransferase involved in cell wall biosynthesis
LNICLISREFPPKSGGIGYYVYYLSKKLIERGHNVSVITRGSAGRTKKRVIDGITVYYVTFLPLYPFHIWLHSVFVNKIFRSLEPRLTLVNLHSPLPSPVTTLLPIITTVHSPSKRLNHVDDEVFDFKTYFDKMQSIYIYPPIETKIFNRSRKITVVSSSVARELKEYQLNTKELTVVGNGVDEKSFFPKCKRDALKKYVLFAGVLRAGKGLFDLIECASIVCRTRTDVKFVVCGAGPFSKVLKDKVGQIGLEKQFIFTGLANRKRLLHLYQNATLFVFPSHYEGLPTVILEAMACGLPVVATDVGGNREIISSGVNGLLIPPKSPEIMAKAVVKLWDDDALRIAFGEAARKTIESKYTWDIIADNTLKTYDKVLAESNN